MACSWSVMSALPAFALNHLNWEPAAEDAVRVERVKTLMLRI